MDKVLGVHQKKSCKPKLLHQQQQKGKKKREDQVKVVYISSPVNFNTSASEFRSLVQQLTGRDSSGHQYIDGGRRELKTVNENPVFKEEHEHAINGAAETTISEVGITSSSLINSNLDSLLDDHHVYDDVSMSHIFVDSLLPSNIWYNNI